jgi:hypothetical protein
MSTNIPRERFKHLGDWLIARSETIIGGFQIGVCISIIRAESPSWFTDSITDEDINRILARYKEHVTFWNVGINVIRSELQAFANAVNTDFNYIAQKFDGLPARRFPPEIYYNNARIQKKIFVPQPQYPAGGYWTITNFTQDDIYQLQGNLYSLDPQATISILTPPTVCQIQGRFTAAEFDEFLKRSQPYPTYGQNQVQYVKIVMF